jgi:hypothetical protein
MTKKRRLYRPRVGGGQVMLQADLERLHKYSSRLKAWTQSQMKCGPWWKASGRNWCTSCRQRHLRVRLLPRVAQLVCAPSKRHTGARTKSA